MDNKSKFVGYDFERNVNTDENTIHVVRIGRGSHNGEMYVLCKFTCQNEANYINVYPITDTNWNLQDKCNHCCNLCSWIKTDDGMKHVCTKYVPLEKFNRIV